MNKAGTEADYLGARLPLCDLCGMLDQVTRPALYDGATSMGAWAYMCEQHFQSHGLGLGLGRGQKLILKEV